MSAADPAIAEPEAPPRDPVRHPVLERLEAELGADLLQSELVVGDDLIVRVDRAAWRRTAEVCRDQLGMRYFCFLSGIDWKQNPALKGDKFWEPPDAGPEDMVAEAEADEEASGTDEPAELAAAEAEEEAAEEAAETAIDETGHYPTGVAGGDTRFQVFARLYDVEKGHIGITLKADLPTDDPRIDSLVPLFRGADWHEREAWEMYGFIFDGHPGLRHLYLPGEFEGFPLRKDFPLLARLVKPWPGLVDVEPMPGGGDDPPEDAALGA